MFRVKNWAIPHFSSLMINERPSIVVIASTMRSGSTLLKALLAEADDVLNLPETSF